MTALVLLTLKVLIAATFYGTEDIRTWTGFAQGVDDRGPVGVYGIDFTSLNGTLYNHPPLVGYYLALMNQLAEWGLSLRVTLRAASSVADVLSALLVFEILSRRVSLRRTTWSALAVAASPLLLLISGYHGNTDPVFVMLVLLGSFLIIDKDRPLLGGATLAIALGIKLVPVVVLPTIAVYLLRHRRDQMTLAASGFVMAFSITWGPAILREPENLSRNVLGYSGIADRPWGLVRILDELSWVEAAEFLIGPGKSLIVVACALVPAALVWRRRESAIPCVALSLVSFLTFSPAFGVQYLAWAAAAAYLLDAWAATLYNLLGGLVLFVIYDHWNGGLPWTHVAAGQVFTPVEVALAALLWATLFIVMARGLRAPPFRNRSGPGSAPEPAPDVDATVPKVTVVRVR